MSQFLRRKSGNAASTAGLNRAPIVDVFVWSVGWTWILTVSSAGLKEVDLDLLSSSTSSLSTVERSAVSSSAVRASDNARNPTQAGRA